MVQWDDGTHEILIYNDDNGYGLTRCERRIGPWDIWLVGEVTCEGCKKAFQREEAVAKHAGNEGPREWFPPAPEERKSGS